VTVYASAVSLVGESVTALSIARCRAIIDAGVLLVFVIGDANRARLESEQHLRDAHFLRNEITLATPTALPGDVAYVRECGHGMFYDNATVRACRWGGGGGVVSCVLTGGCVSLSGLSSGICMNWRMSEFETRQQQQRRDHSFQCIFELFFTDRVK
jgi:hypothetical protein